MAFNLTWPGGLVDGATRLLARKLLALDVNQSRAVDGFAGGTYTPSNPIAIDNDGLQMSGLDNVTLASRAITRRQTMEGFSTSGNWSRRPGGIWRNTASGGVAEQFLDIPNGQTLDSVTVRWVGASGHASDPVDTGITMPSIDVKRVDASGTITSLGSQIDTVTVRASYEAAHSITVSSIAHIIDRTAYHYFVEITGESGAEFVANAEALQCITVCTCTAYTEY